MMSSYDEAKNVTKYSRGKNPKSLVNLESVAGGGRKGLYKGTTKYYALECLYLSDKRQNITLITEYVSQAKRNDDKLNEEEKINRDGIRGRLGELVKAGMIAKRMTVKKHVKKEVRFWVLEKGKHLYRMAK